MAEDSTHADRVTAILLKLFPAEVHDRVRAGEWGKAGAPYFFEILPDGKRKFVVLSPTGDRLGVIGDSHNDAIAKMEARLG